MATPSNIATIGRWLAKELAPHQPKRFRLEQTRWIRDERATDPTLPYYRHPWIFCEPGIIRSGGGWRDFILAQTLYERGGKRIRTFLVNGDLGGTRNRSHQNNLLFWMNQAQQPFPVLIVPFSALEAAGIDRATIKPIEIREDRWEEIRHDIKPFSKADVIWKEQDNEGRNFGYGWWEDGRIRGRPELRFQRLRTDGGRTTEIRTYFRGWQQVKRDEKGHYSIENRHWLGDSCFRAKVGSRYRTFVSSFDYQERFPLYFLAEVPPTARVESVEDAVLALSPPIVHAAVAQGRLVKRQGDMFAIPTELTTADVLARTGGEIVRMQGVMGTDHIATESVTGKKRVTYARGKLHHKPRGRRADHAIVHLGEDWHLVVPNAVPRRRRGMTAARV